MKLSNKWAATIIRFTLGLIFIFHGWEKLIDLWNHLILGREWQLINLVGFMPFLPNFIWAVIVTVTEFLGGLAVFLGYRTKLGALGLSAVMMGAIVGVHFPGFWSELMASGGEPLSKIEFPLVLLTMAMSLLFTGPGRYNIRIKK